MNDIDRMKPSQILDKFFQDFDIGKEDEFEIKHLLRGTYDGENAPKFTKLLKRWYESLEQGNPDYSVYDDPAYFFDLIVCFLEYSRHYLRTIVNPKSFDGDSSLFNYFEKINTVVDLGCGMGYTTAFIKCIFEDSNIYGTNIKDTLQYPFAESLGQKTGFSLVESVSEINEDIDLIFASEYFEHFERPMEHLNEIIKNGNPKYLFIANSFNTIAIGHFREYKHGDEIILQDKMARRFSRYLIDMGYKKIKTKVWNGKPTLWERVE